MPPCLHKIDPDTVVTRVSNDNPKEAFHLPLSRFRVDFHFPLPSTAFRVPPSAFSAVRFPPSEFRVPPLPRSAFRVPPVRFPPSAFRVQTGPPESYDKGGQITVATFRSWRDSSASNP